MAKLMYVIFPVRGWSEGRWIGRRCARYRENLRFTRLGTPLVLHHQTGERCVEAALAYGPL